MVACERVAALFYVPEPTLLDVDTLHSDIGTIELTGFPVDVAFFKDSIIVSVFSATSVADVYDKVKVISPMLPLQI